MVAGCDGVKAEDRRHAGEEGEAYAPGRHLQGLASESPHSRAQGVEGQSVACGERLDEAGVVGGVWAQAMVNVQDHCVEAVRGLQVCHQGEQSHGIGTA